MKFLARIPVACILIILMATSCYKEITTQVSGEAGIQRKIQFVLYTDRDFSTDNKNIFFEVSIQNKSGQVIWDSSLAPMAIKDIPNPAHKIMIEKSLLTNDNSALKTSFYYYIQDVGYSWYIDSCKAGETFKVVDYNFQ
jgi:hypothetical protein